MGLSVPSPFCTCTSSDCLGVLVYTSVGQYGLQGQYEPQGVPGPAAAVAEWSLRVPRKQLFPATLATSSRARALTVKPGERVRSPRAGASGSGWHSRAAEPPGSQCLVMSFALSVLGPRLTLSTLSSTEAGLQSSGARRGVCVAGSMLSPFSRQHLVPSPGVGDRLCLAGVSFFLVLL